MNKIIDCQKYSLFYFMVPIIALFSLALFNLSVSFSFDLPKIIFCEISFIFVILALTFLGEILERNFINSSKTSLLSAGLTMACLCLMLDESFLSNCFSHLINSDTFSSYFKLYIEFLSHIINSVLTVVFCISLIIYLAQILLGSIIKFITLKEVSFSLVRQVSLIFIISITLKSILKLLF